MIKRFICILMVIIFFAFPLTLHADVVSGNHFFYENEEKTERIGKGYSGKSFIVNSPSGFVIPKEEPGSKKGIRSDGGYPSGWGYNDIDDPKYNVFVFKNCEIIRIDAVYLYNGEFWGVMLPSHMYQPPGWVLMDDLLMRYELEDFEAENKDRIYTFTGTFNTSPLKKLIVWQWPGSDREKIVMDVLYTVNYTKVYNAYKDSEGCEWGETGSGWICLSDPENKTDIRSFNPAPKPIKWSHDGNRDWTKEAEVYPPAEPTFFQAKPFYITLIIIVISTFILIAAIITIGLVLQRKIKNKERQQSDTRSSE